MSQLCKVYMTNTWRQKSKRVVTAFIDHCQSLLPHTYASYYLIPQPIIDICFSYYLHRTGTISVKTVFIGDANAGKSSIISRFMHPHGQWNTMNTHHIGYFPTKTVHIDGIDVKHEMWDAYTQLRYNSISPMFYRHSKVAIIVYDITNNWSFNRMDKYLADCIEYMDSDAILCLVGNKMDLVGTVTSVKAQEFASTNHMLWFEVSAKTGQNIEHMLHTIATLVSETLDMDRKEDVCGSQGVRLSQNHIECDPSYVSCNLA
eukprot:453318_1